MDKLMSREQIRQLIKENNLKTTGDIQRVLKDIFAETLQEMLEGELDDSLGYAKNVAQDKKTTNRRNVHSKKTVRSEYGDVELEIPRDRDGDRASGSEETSEEHNRHRGSNPGSIRQRRQHP